MIGTRWQVGSGTAGRVATWLLVGLVTVLGMTTVYLAAGLGP